MIARNPAESTPAPQLPPVGFHPDVSYAIDQYQRVWNLQESEVNAVLAFLDSSACEIVPLRFENAIVLTGKSWSEAFRKVQGKIR